MSRQGNQREAVFPSHAEDGTNGNTSCHLEIFVYLDNLYHTIAVFVKHFLKNQQ